MYVQGKVLTFNPVKEHMGLSNEHPIRAHFLLRAEVYTDANVSVLQTNQG